MELSNTIPSNDSKGNAEFSILTPPLHIHQVDGTFTKVGEYIMATAMYNNGSGGGSGYRIGIGGYINGSMVIQQGHGDTYGVGGGVATTLGGAPGMSWTIAKRSLYPTNFQVRIHRVRPG